MSAVDSRPSWLSFESYAQRFGMSSGTTRPDLPTSRRSVSSCPVRTRHYSTTSWTDLKVHRQQEFLERWLSQTTEDATTTEHVVLCGIAHSGLRTHARSAFTYSEWMGTEVMKAKMDAICGCQALRHPGMRKVEPVLRMPDFTVCRAKRSFTQRFQ